MGGWGSFLDKLMDKLPISGRKERIKNKIADLEREQHELLKEPADIKRSKRLSDISVELARLRQQSENFNAD